MRRIYRASGNFLKEISQIGVKKLILPYTDPPHLAALHGEPPRSLYIIFSIISMLAITLITISVSHEASLISNFWEENEFMETS